MLKNNTERGVEIHLFAYIQQPEEKNNCQFVNKTNIKRDTKKFNPKCKWTSNVSCRHVARGGLGPPKLNQAPQKLNQAPLKRNPSYVPDIKTIFYNTKVKLFYKLNISRYIIRFVFLYRYLRMNRLTPEISPSPSGGTAVCPPFCVLFIGGPYSRWTPFILLDLPGFDNS